MQKNVVYATALKRCSNDIIISYKFVYCSPCHHHHFIMYHTVGRFFIV